MKIEKIAKLINDLSDDEQQELFVVLLDQARFGKFFED